MSEGLVLELDRIADRVATLARIVHALREENQMLRDRLDTARDRVELLIARMPADS